MMITWQFAFISFLHISLVRVAYYQALNNVSLTVSQSAKFLNRDGSFENEATQTKTEATKTWKRSTLDRKQRPLNLENEAPKSRKRST